MDTKKNNLEFTSLFQLFKTAEKNLPQIFLIASEDSYEFEITVDFYKDILRKQGANLDILTFVPEGGEHNKFYTELFTPDMFFPRKLIILKSGANFFKPFLDTKAVGEFKDYVSGFKNNIINISDQITVLVHYNAKDIPAGLFTLFQNQFSFYKPKTLYQNDMAKALKEILEQEQIQLTDDAHDEFIHKTPISIGAYIKGIRKLKQYLNKSKFTLEDIDNILFTQTDINPSNLVDFLIRGRKVDFFKEFTKYSDNNGEILAFLTRLMYKLDEIRKIKVIRSRSNGEIPIPLMDDLLKTASYSDKRKNFMRKQLMEDGKNFTERSINQFYEILIEMNIKYKSGLRNEEGRVYFIQKIFELFRIIQLSVSS